MGVGGVTGGGPVNFPPPGGSDPKKAAYEISQALVNSAKSYLESVNKIKTLESRIDELDREIEVARAKRDYRAEAELAKEKTRAIMDSMNEQCEIDMSIIPKMNDQVDQLNQLSPSLIDPQDKQIVAQILHIFEKPTSITAKTLVGLINISEALKP